MRHCRIVVTTFSPAGAFVVHLGVDWGGWCVVRSDRSVVFIGYVWLCDGILRKCVLCHAGVAGAWPVSLSSSVAARTIIRRDLGLSSIGALSFYMTLARYTGKRDCTCVYYAKPRRRCHFDIFTYAYCFQCYLNSHRSCLNFKYSLKEFIYHIVSS